MKEPKFYKCNFCSTPFSSPKMARACEQRRLIAPVFRVGERVGTRLTLWCLRCLGSYEIKKIVIAGIRGPFPSDPPNPSTHGAELQLTLSPPAHYAHEYRYDLDVYLSERHPCNSEAQGERLYVVPEYKLKKLRSRTRKPARPLRHKK